MNKPPIAVRGIFGAIIRGSINATAMTQAYRIHWRNPVVVSVTLIALFTSCRDSQEHSVNHDTADHETVWLPYAAGVRAVCGQGPKSTRSHKDIFAWDFMLTEGEQVVAVAAGRVFWVIDDRAGTGSNSFNESNQIFIDHGGGRFAIYFHHKTGTARVHPGQLVAAGHHLADVGKTGAIQPHIHFDLRGPSWHKTHDLRFRTRDGPTIEVNERSRLTSNTPDPQPTPTSFEDSVLQGDEFAENGVMLAGGSYAFRLTAEKPVVVEGRVLQPAQEVGFYVWKSGERSEYSVSAVPESDGRFRLIVKLPAALRGMRWYRITIRDQAGVRPDTATLPLLVE